VSKTKGSQTRSIIQREYIHGRDINHLECDARRAIDAAKPSQSFQIICEGGVTTTWMVTKILKGRCRISTLLHFVNVFGKAAAHSALRERGNKAARWATFMEC
jgi:hypothetical protein